MSFRRREFLSCLTGAGAFGALGLSLPWSMGVASQDQGGYRALVCIFLNGGNDGNDTLIPMDGGYGDYARGHSALSLPLEDLVPIRLWNTDRRLGLNPALRPLARVSDEGRIAWVANVGPLVEPMTVESLRSGQAVLPPLLFSHPDQIRLVSGGVPNSSVGNSGWGGRAVESLESRFEHSPLVSLALNEDNWLMRGARRAPTTSFPPEGPTWFAGIDLRNPQFSFQKPLYLGAAAQQANPDSLSRIYRGTLSRVYEESIALRKALDSVSGDDLRDFPDTSIGHGLRHMVNLLRAGKATGVSRQFLHMDWGGFDTHSDQRGSHSGSQDSQLSELATALAAMDASLVNLGMTDEVTVFILSDFGRPLQPASGAGTDHGWGNHYFVMGGAVNGGRLVGQMPSLVIGGPDDFEANGQGRWVPTTSTDQLGATLVEWLGVRSEKLTDIFPYLVNFNQKTLSLFH